MMVGTMTNETKEYTYMKDITNYTAAKYSRGDYSAIEDGIYKIENNDEILYVTSYWKACI